MVVHKFSETLAFSHSCADLPVWRSIYSSLFPTLIGMEDMRHTGLHQKRGIDRILTLSNGKQITVDEKVRRKAYPDILLEYVSVRRHGRRDVPGWVCNPDYDCDYIAYAISPLGKGWLFPTERLQMAWRQNQEHWLRDYRSHFASTGDKGFGSGTFQTIFCVVPPQEVMRAIGQTLRFEFPPNTIE
jgi:hypothetical protein